MVMSINGLDRGFSFEGVVRWKALVVVISGYAYGLALPPLPMYSDQMYI